MSFQKGSYHTVGQQAYTPLPFNILPTFQQSHLNDDFTDFFAKILFALVAQLVERQTETQTVPGSISGKVKSFFAGFNKYCVFKHFVINLCMLLKIVCIVEMKRKKENLILKQKGDLPPPGRIRTLTLNSETEQKISKMAWAIVLVKMSLF